jgi:hypothetical protein
MGDMSQSIGATSNRMSVTSRVNGAEDEDVLLRAVLRLNGNLLGLVLGTFAAALVFVATIFLVVKGGPVVGPHLGLLANVFIGYSVTLPGSVIGAAYGLITGYLSGVFIAWVYNAIAVRRSAAK